MNPNIRFSMLIALLAALSACGGGGGSGVDSGGIGGTGVVSTGVMTKGSVILNGVRFDDTNAEVSIDDNASKTKDDLKDGMVVQVRGRVGADNVATGGVAELIEAQIEVRGIVTAINASSNPQQFTVLGQTVLVDDLTIYSNLPAEFASIVADLAGVTGTLVEVHGQRDTSGNIRATRVEANATQMGDNLVDEIRGVVSGRSSNTDPIFFVGSQLVNTTGANTLPSGATFANDDIIEVHCTLRPNCINGSSEFVASLVEVENAEDSAFLPMLNGRFEAEGLISGFDSPSDTDFFVAGIPVTRTGSTRYEGGIKDDLANDIKIEAEGTWSGSALIANKIEFKRSVVRLQGEPSAPSGNSFTLQIATVGSVTVVADDFTDLKDGTLPIGTESCVQVRGQRKAVAGQVVTAGEIALSCSSSDRPLIQAPVEAETPEVNVTLLGFAIDVSNPTGTPPWAGIDEQALTRTQFFDAISPPTVNPAGVTVPGTLVKVTFDEVTNLVRQVEIED